MPHRYLYPGTQTLKNRFGVRGAADAERLEALVYADSHKKPAPGFIADMAGLKAVHDVLFGARQDGERPPARDAKCSGARRASGRVTRRSIRGGDSQVWFFRTGVTAGRCDSLYAW